MRVRTKEQNTRRYFTAVWSAFVFITAVVVMFIFAVEKPTPDFVVAAVLVLGSIVAGIIGFLHGITIFVAREKDAAERNEIQL